MVNAFLTNKDFKLSAKNLDNRRLGKQRVEAVQILNIIEKLNVLSKLFNVPFPSDRYLIKEWIRTLITKFKNKRKFLFCYDGEWIWNNKLPIMISRKNYKLISNENSQTYIYTHKKYSLKMNVRSYTFIFDDETIIKISPLFYHPAILMWIGYEDSLKQYIDSHIDEWITRGMKNTLQKYNIQTNDHPSWVSDTDIHQNHKAALCTKEFERRESKWYFNMPDFVDSYDLYSKNPPVKSNKSNSDFKYYIWPYSNDDNKY